MKSWLSSFCLRCFSIFVVVLATVSIATPSSFKNTQSSIPSLEQQFPGILKIANILRSALETQNFELLKPYLRKEPYGRPLYWDNLKSDEPQELSFEAVDNKLYKISRGAQLRLTGNANYGNIPTHVFIETAGWRDNLSHLVFSFYYDKKSKQWFWSGIDEGRLQTQYNP